MILLKRGEGDPDRVANVISCVRPSPLWEVADAVVAFGKPDVHTDVYVERVGDDRYRWSPAHRAGPHALGRVLARFLRCEYHDITIGFVTVDGWCVIGEADKSPTDDYAIFQEPLTTLDGAQEMILAALPLPDDE